MPVTTILNAGYQIATKYALRFYIQDDNSKWVDFSTSVENSGHAALKNIGRIANKVEIGFGFLVSTIQNVELENKDGFFNKPFPSTLKTLDGATAVFASSRNYKRTVLNGRKAKIIVRAYVPLSTMSVSASAAAENVEEYILGHFIIQEVTPDMKNNTVSLKLMSYDGLLQEKNASGIKDGYTYYSYRPVSFILEKILESEFGAPLPATYNIDRSIFMSTIGDATVVSALGRPPLWDGTNWRDKDGLYTRALCYCNLNSIGGRLYLGCDDELWSYDPVTGLYTAIDTTTIATTNPNLKIRKLEYDTGGGTDQLVVWAWIDEYWGSVDDATRAYDRKGWEFHVYVYTGTGTLVERFSSLVASFSYLQYPCSTSMESSSELKSAIGYTATELVSYDLPMFKVENVHIPFEQHPHTVGDHVGNLNITGFTPNYYKDDSYDALLTAVNSTTPIEGIISSDSTFFYTTKGMYAFVLDMIWSPTHPGGRSHTPIKFYVGQDHCTFLSNRTVSSIRSVYWWRYECAAYINGGYRNPLFRPMGDDDTIWPAWYHCEHVRLCAADIRNTAAVYTKLVPSTLEDSHPLCMAINGTSNKAYAFFIKYYADATAYKSYAVRIDLTDPTFIVTDPFVSVQDITVGETGDKKYWTPISVCFFDNNSNDSPSTDDKAVVVFYHRANGMYVLAFTNTYKLYSSLNLYSDSTILKMSHVPFLGLTQDVVDHCIYAFAMGEGRIIKVTKAGAMSVLNSDPAVSDETGLLAGLAVNQNHTATYPEVYGVSSPTTHIESYMTYPSGMYILFRAHQSISDIVPLADTNDLNKMEVLKYLAQSRDSIAFFDHNGNFNYVRRKYSITTPDYTIDIDDGEIRKIVDLALDYGYDDTYNIVKVQPYDEVYTPPGGEALTLIIRTKTGQASSDTDSLPFVDYTLEQRDNDRKIVRAYCITGGALSKGTSRWKYQSVESEIEAVVNSDALSSATTLSLRSVYGGDATEEGIHTLDFAIANDSVTGAETVRRITAVDVATNDITIASAFGFELKAKSTVIIIRGNTTSASGSVRNQWSDEGVTYITAAAGASTTFIKVRTAKGLSVGTVFRVANFVTEYRITAIVIGDGTYDTIYFVREGTATNTLVDTLATGDIIYAFYAPSTADAYELGGTNIFIHWIAGTGTAEVDYTETFLTGDYLRIECPGKNLEAEESSLQVAVDNASLSRNITRKELVVDDNRFVTRTIAKDMAQRIIVNYGEPRYHVTVTIPLAPYMDIVTASNALTVIAVKDRTTFPMSENYTEYFRIDQIEHDLSSMLTTLTLFCLSAY